MALWHVWHVPGAAGAAVCSQGGGATGAAPAGWLWHATHDQRATQGPSLVPPCSATAPVVPGGSLRGRSEHRQSRYDGLLGLPNPRRLEVPQAARNTPSVAAVLGRLWEPSNCDFNLSRVGLRNSTSRLVSRPCPLNSGLGHREGHALSRFTGSFGALAIISCRVEQGHDDAHLGQRQADRS